MVTTQTTTFCGATLKQTLCSMTWWQCDCLQSDMFDHASVLKLHQKCTEKKCFRSDLKINQICLLCEQSLCLVRMSIHTQSWYYHLLPMNLFTCGMFQTGVCGAFPNFPSLLLLLSQLVVLKSVLLDVLHSVLSFLDCFLCFGIDECFPLFYWDTSVLCPLFSW